MARTSASAALVLAVAGDLVTLDLGAGGTEDVLMRRGVTVAAGDLATVTTIGRARFVTGVLGAGAAPLPETAGTEGEVPAAPSQINSGSWLFAPSEPGTYRDGWREDTALLWQGRYGEAVDQLGAAWYGVGPTSLPGALVGLSVYLMRVEGSSEPVAPTMTLYAGTERPEGEPTILSTAPGPALLLGEWQLWDAPPDWLAPLSDGTAGGIGCSASASELPIALTAEGSGMSIVCYWEDAA